MADGGVGGQSVEVSFLERLTSDARGQGTREVRAGEDVLIAIASQPRCPGATSQTSARAARRIDAVLTDAGFSRTCVEALPLDPRVVCVLAVNNDYPDGPDDAS